MPGRPPPSLCLLFVLLALSLAACGQQQTVGGSTGPIPSAAETNTSLALLKTQRNHLLDGGTDAFRQRLASLRGVPVVVNQWASWCGPCRFEFPFFQHLAARYDGKVAFLGVDAQDSSADAAAFLKKFPVPYPHFSDPQASIARTFKGGRAWPTTAFFAPRGTLVYTHIGSYPTQAKLNADIRRYALGG